MSLVLTILSVIFGLVSLVGAIWLLVEAFKEDMAQGLLTLCVPCYAFYYAFARLDSPYKGTIIGLWLGGMAGNIVCQAAAAALEPAAGVGGFR
jgi:hypothetical protein